MDNLKDPKNIVLMNTLGWGDIALYGDTENHVRVLVLKQLGISIPGAPYVSGDIDTESSTANAGVPPSGIKISKSCTDDGDLAAMKIILTPECPCEDCNYEYGIQLRKRVKNPGVNNPDFHDHYQPYVGKLAKVHCDGTTGMITTADQIAMESDLMAQISHDEQAWGTLQRYYIMEDLDSSTDSIVTITYNGVVYTITATGHTAGQLAVAINATATLSDAVMAFGTSDPDVIMITTFLPGVEFTAAPDTATSTTDQIERGLLFMTNDLNRHVSIVVDPGFATTEKMSFIYLTGLTTAGSTYVKLSGSSFTTVSGTAANNATEATTASNLNTAMGALVTADEALATAIASDGVVIWGGSTIDRLKVTHSALSTAVNTIKATGDGFFPFMTADDIFGLFNEQHMGELANQVYSEQVQKGAKYCKYELQFLGDDVPLVGDGASYYGHHKQRLAIYIKQDLTDDNIWTDAANESVFKPSTAPVSPDRTIEDLLEVWAKSAITYW